LKKSRLDCGKIPKIIMIKTAIRPANASPKGIGALFSLNFAYGFTRLKIHLK
jgi:hypothetical protein